MRFLVLLFFFVNLHSAAQDTIATGIVIDSIGNEVSLILDAKDQPLNYYSPVFTPVCVDGSCYPININIYWDLAGNYLNYSLDTGVILTKIDHLPFTEFDYGLLHRMIANPSSALANFTIYELTIPKSIMEVDGVSGATRPELSGSFVPDALFTSYTLWHLARRPKSELFQYTHSRYFNENWIAYLMENEQLGCSYSIIEYLLNSVTGNTKVAKFIKLYNEHEEHFTAKSLSLFSKEELQSEYGASEFEKIYTSTINQQMKLGILELWENLGINESQLIAITSEIGESSSCFNIELQLIDHYQDWPEAEYELFYTKTQQQKNMMRKDKMMKVLNRRVGSYPKSFKKLLK